MYSGATTSSLACEQAHLFGRGASTKSWREEWGEAHTFPRFAGSRYKWACSQATSSYHIKHRFMIFTLLPICAPILTFSGTLPVTSPLRAAAIGARSTRTSIFAICASAVTTIRTFPSASLCLDWRFTRLCTFSYSYGQKFKTRVTQRSFSWSINTLLCLLGLMISNHKNLAERTSVT